ncbi:dual specificity protein phosphatase 22-B isoform X2 [Gasterosteus aculeatus]
MSQQMELNGCYWALPVQSRCTAHDLSSQTVNWSDRSVGNPLHVMVVTVLWKNKRTLGLLLISGPLTGNWWHFVPQEMTYLCISAADLPSQNLTQHFKQSITFMHESRLKGEGCLVHCLAGVSRSVTLVLAYIMTVTRLGWQEALAAVRVVRPCAGPNLGFQRQLQEFEATQADQFREWLQKEYKDNSFSDEADLRDLLAAASKVNGDGVEKQESTPPGDL